ncbi:CAP domain-containing protein [Glaciihabitans sp. dw_435]|uniref:CAP domain-containing protein n=1 Tax=Glaciihabitans sp. dw_435 TaxID=2720081 RepID=UPI001BD312DB|nr:CAP domain-containing protein [Glaciihabitans sp. dw_435]
MGEKTRRVAVAAAAIAAAVVGAMALVPAGNREVAHATSVVVASTPADDRAAVASAYRSRYEPALRVDIGWTGATSTCTAGSIAPTAQQATLDAINFVRALAGLRSVSFDAALSAKAQQAALVYYANRNLSHEIPDGWLCSTATAREAGANSNVAFGAGGAKAIDMYMDDPGTSNTVVGHRRWILNPSAVTMGSGSTSASNALWVIGQRARVGTFANPAWVSWPTDGYFPSQLEPDGRWSLSGDAARTYDFRSAKISVRDSSGAVMPVTRYAAADGYGNDTLVWKVDGIAPAAGGQVRAYSVSVTGIVKAGKTLSHSYTVSLFDAMALQVTRVASLAGAARSPITAGRALAAVNPAFSPSAASFTYRWYRGTTAIPGATRANYTVTAADRGSRIHVAVTASRASYTPVVSVSAATAVVVR